MHKNNHITFSTQLNLDPTTVVLNQSNALVVQEQSYWLYRKYVSQTQLWHKFIIHDGAKMQREKILKTIVEKVEDLFPIEYKTENNNATFIARNCAGAIDVLCKDNLIVKCEGGPPLILSIILNGGIPTDSKSKIQDQILAVLQKRFKKASGVLNLENLVADSGLKEVYCSLSQPKIMSFVLSLARNLPIKVLKMCNNEIKNLDSLEVIWSCRNIVSVDLRKNLIEDVVSIYSLKNMIITDLWLDGNPLCDNFDETSYIKTIKEILPSIERLDGVLLGNNGLPALRRNFLCKKSGQEFVDQFLEHYFTLYDTKDRNCLEPLYHHRCLFSLTCSFLPGHVTSRTSRLEPYKYISRNLLKMSDFSKCDKYLAYGSASTVKVLCELPPTEHDPYMFTVDLLFYSETTAVILVTGVFREVVTKMSDDELYLGFTRTFVLCAAPHGEYNIINEEFHISNATTIQAQRAFKVVRVAKAVVNPANYSPEEKNEVIEALARITSLNMEYSKTMLERNNWDLKTTLTRFVDLYKNEKLPASAFKI